MRIPRLALLCVAVFSILALGQASSASAATTEVKLAKRVLTVGRAGNLTVKLSCVSSQSVCLGRISLKARHASRALGKRSLASGTFIGVGGRTKALNLHLSKKALAQLKRRHSLRALATIQARDLAGTVHTTLATVTLKLS